MKDLLTARPKVHLFHRGLLSLIVRSRAGWRSKELALVAKRCYDWILPFASRPWCLVSGQRLWQLPMRFEHSSGHIATSWAQFVNFILADSFGWNSSYSTASGYFAGFGVCRILHRSCYSASTFCYNYRLFYMSYCSSSFFVLINQQVLKICLELISLFYNL